MKVTAIQQLTQPWKMFNILVLSTPEFFSHLPVVTGQKKKGESISESMRIREGFLSLSLSLTSWYYEVDVGVEGEGRGILLAVLSRFGSG